MPLSTPILYWPHSQVAALSCDKLDDHNTWLKDVVAHCANKVGSTALGFRVKLRFELGLRV